MSDRGDFDSLDAEVVLHLKADSGFESTHTHRISVNQWGNLLNVCLGNPVFNSKEVIYAWTGEGCGVISDVQKKQMIENGKHGGEFKIAADSAVRHDIPLYKKVKRV